MKLKSVTVREHKTFEETELEIAGVFGESQVVFKAWTKEPASWSE